jgi:hypothetical protein
MNGQKHGQGVYNYKHANTKVEISSWEMLDLLQVLLELCPSSLFKRNNTVV